MHNKTRMNKKINLIFALFFGFYSAFAQQTIPVQENILENAVASIDTGDLKKYIAVMAADSLEGRETGTIGQKKAAEYLRSVFRKNEINPVSIGGHKTYFQEFELYREKPVEISIVARNEQFSNLRDFIYTGSVNDSIISEIMLVFGGYGRKEDFAGLEQKYEGVVILSTSGSYSEELNLAEEYGYEYVFFIHDSGEQAFEELVDLYQSYFGSSGLKFEKDEKEYDEEHMFFISPSMTENLFDCSIADLKEAAEKNTQGKVKALNSVPSIGIEFRAKKELELVQTENVLGMIKGMEKPEEVIIISAHYDHLGIRDGEIYHGADDNGSGTATLLELSEAFSIARKYGIGPDRSILFVAFTGEEKGLFGSRYYVKNPVIPLSQTVANFNMDMIGRTDRRYTRDSSYVYIIGSDKISPDLHRISEEVNRTYTGLILDYKYNDEDDPNRLYYRSDHYSFARNGIPVIFYFTGLHEDYHKPTDTVDKIELNRVKLIGDLIFLTVWEVANREDRLVVK